MTGVAITPDRAHTVERIYAGASASAEPQDVDARSSFLRRVGQSGTLRAAIFGVSDGLVSNLALVLGVAAAASDSSMIVLAGLAGLLAGACSMAAGEWISMTSQRELFERQIDQTRARIRADQCAAGTDAQSSGKATEDREVDAMVRAELGLDPEQLGSPWGAATGSLLSFAAGALVPLIPFVLIRGPAALPVAVASSLAALLVVGAGVSVATGRPMGRCALRQVTIGAAAAGVTFLIGSALGIQAQG
jgi:vacuolar iron transporter family protein